MWRRASDVPVVEASEDEEPYLRNSIFWRKSYPSRTPTPPYGPPL